VLGFFSYIVLGRDIERRLMHFFLF